MSVNFRFVKKNGETSAIFKHGCFGTLMGSSSIRASDNIVYNLRDYDYLEYVQHTSNYSDIPLSRKKDFEEWLRKDTAFKLKLFRDITNKFPWMKDVITVYYANKNTLISSHPTPVPAARYTLVARLDLTKPGDTVWFCLNLFRLITRFSHATGLAGSYQNPNQLSPMKIFYELTEVDAWKTALLTFGFSCNLSTSFSGEFSMNIHRNTVGFTCLTSFNHINKKNSEAFIENPSVFLNKNSPVKGNHSRGLSGNMGNPYFIGQYMPPDDYREISNNDIYDTNVVIESLFGKEMLDKIRSYKTVSINIINFTKSDGYNVRKYVN